jgi:hypothetical protein
MPGFSTRSTASARWRGAESSRHNNGGHFYADTWQWIYTSADARSGSDAPSGNSKAPPSSRSGARTQGTHGADTRTQGTEGAQSALKRAILRDDLPRSWTANHNDMEKRRER